MQINRQDIGNAFLAYTAGFIKSKNGEIETPNITFEEFRSSIIESMENEKLNESKQLKKNYIPKSIKIPDEKIRTLVNKAYELKLIENESQTSKNIMIKNYNQEKKFESIINLKK